MFFDQDRQIGGEQLTVFDHDLTVDDRQVDPRRLTEDQRGDRIMQRARHSDIIKTIGDDIGRHADGDAADIVAAEDSGAATRRHFQRLARRQAGRIPGDSL